MKKRKLLALPVLLVVALISGNAASAEDGMLTAYVIHGINGEDFDMDKALPVDVSVSGLGCAIPYFEFSDRVGPLSVPSGTYDITISLADMENPCDGTEVIALSDVMLPAEANATIIAHRTADGSPGAGDLLGLGVTASIFANDFTYTGRGKARILAHHTALAPSVDVVVSRDYEDINAPGVTVPGFSNPTSEGDAVLSQINAEFRPGEWDVALELDGAAVFGPDTVQLKPFTATYIYAVGDFLGGTFQYLVYTEEGLKEKKDRSARSRAYARRGR
jgi:hypothetical protein